MEKRREELLKLSSYTQEIDNELTMILQSLQWDRKHLLQNPVMVACKYNSNHKVPPDKKEEHEKECFLRQNGYNIADHLLPDPLDSEANTLVKLRKEDIEKIIGNASRSDPSFKKGVGCHGPEPLSVGRLQSSYSSDERRAIHDAVVSAVPSCHDLTDLALPSGADDQSTRVILSRTEILVELRNMRRRRTKYRVAAKTRNYSDVLRDVIKTQMEHFADGQSETAVNETVEHNEQTDTHSDRRQSRQATKVDDRHKYDQRYFPKPILKVEINTERHNSTERGRDYSRERSDRAYRYEERRRGSDRHRDRLRHVERSQEKHIKIENDGSTERSRNYSRERSNRTYEHEEGRRVRDRDQGRYTHDESSREKRDVDRINKHQEQFRKRSHDEDSRNYYNNDERRYDDSRERRKAHSHKEYESDKRTRSYHNQQEVDLLSQVKDEPGHRDRTTERSHDKSREKYSEQNRKTSELKHHENRRRDRGSKEDQRMYVESSSSRVYIKQEREDGTTREYRHYYEEHEARGSKHRSSGNSDSDSSRSGKTIKKEKYKRYYDRPAETVYDPNKKIKTEK